MLVQGVEQDATVSHVHNVSMVTIGTSLYVRNVNTAKKQ